MEFPESAQDRAHDENAMENWVAIRDSKDPAGPVLFLVEHEWRVLLRRIKSGHYDPD
ncbi:DUF397 domain-containing protein [Actinomadura sp. 9N215]|uniref:DUF397 domain-containing protein n=1 Tax=Actinomadura sp. 9N215 TaxID=3375150 RepID=UPI0037B2871D